MKTHDFYFELPPELIAQTPLERRDGSRLLVLDKVTGETEHRHFYDLPEYLRPGDCLILNNSRVLPARLLGHRVPGGGACEILLLIDKGDNVWECLVRPGKKLRKGARVSFGDGELTAEIVDELNTRASSWRCWSGWAKCPCRRTSRRSCGTANGIRRCTPR